MRCLALLLAGVLAACLGQGHVPCVDGLVCAATQVCIPELGRCVSAEQARVCEDVADGLPCSVDGIAGVCATGVCGAGCGDGDITGGEECDLDNFAGETCLDRGYYAGTLTCDRCVISEESCTGFCGDGEVNGSEFCDGVSRYSSCTQLGFGYGVPQCAGDCTNRIAGCGIIGWRSMTVFATKKTRDLAGSADGRVYSVGLEGSILVRDGESWYPLNSGTIEDLNALWVTPEEGAWVVGASGTVLYVAGEAVTPHDSGIDTNLRAVAGRAANDVFAAGDNSVLLHYDGSTWSPQTFPELDLPVRSLAFTADGALFAVAGSSAASTVFRRYQGTWTSTVVPYASAVWAASATDAFVSAFGGVYRFDGDDWLPSLEAAAIFRGMTGTGTSNLYTSAPNLVYRFDGSRWQSIPAPFTAATGVIETVGATTYVTETEGGTIHRFEGSWWDVEDQDLYDVKIADDGTVLGIDLAFQTMQRVDGAWIDSFDQNAGGLHLAGSTRAHAALFSGDVVRWDGDTWTSLGANHSDPLYGVHAVSDDSVFAVGGGDTVGAVLHYDGDGWTTVATEHRMRGIWAEDDTFVIAVGNQGTVMTFDGQTWTTAVIESTEPSLKSVWGTSSDNLFAVSASGAAFYSDGVQWTQITELASSIGAVLAISGSSSSDIFALGAAKLSRFDGSAWAPVTDFPGTAYSSIAVSPGLILVAGGDPPALHRLTPWTCEASEVLCTDRLDNDCDGLFDADDPDCAP